jgi:tungstate transport system permease protein
MSALVDIFQQSIGLILKLDSGLINIILLTFKMTFFAVLFGGTIGVVLGMIPAIFRFPGRQLYLSLLHAFMGLPPVVVGLVLYLLLSRSGPMGFLNLLYTPSAMILAQTILIIPIVAALSANLIEHMWLEYREHWLSFGLSPMQKMIQIIIEARFALVGILLAGLGRSLSEVGAVMIVGGNIANYTRVMTTAIVLETSKGELALALSLGILLIVFSIMLNITLLRLKNKHNIEAIA